jgi:hypothetical protein
LLLKDWYQNQILCELVDDKVLMIVVRGTAPDMWRQSMGNAINECFTRPIITPLCMVCVQGSVYEDLKPDAKDEDCTDGLDITIPRVCKKGHKLAPYELKFGHPLLKDEVRSNTLWGPVAGVQFYTATQDWQQRGNLRFTELKSNEQNPARYQGECVQTVGSSEILQSICE